MDASPLPRRPRVSRRPRIPAVLGHRRRVTEQVRIAKVSISGDPVEQDGAQDEDGGWKLVGDRGYRHTPDPAADLRPIGVKSKFWALTDEDSDEEEVVSLSPSTPDLVRQAAVHGFTKEDMVEAEAALQDQSIQRRVEARTTPATENTKVELVRNIMRALIHASRPTATPWLGWASCRGQGSHRR